jgi:hypothetical protein
MYAKYTTVFLGAGIVMWLALSPTHRRWLLNPWPYLGGVLSIALFVPVLAWNAEREWASFAYQASRVVVHDIQLKFTLEFLASQIGLMTPPLFLLAVFGLARPPEAPTAPSARTLLACLTLPLLISFLWHSVHERVQGNWPFAVYPAAACAAALGWRFGRGNAGAVAGWARAATRAAAPAHTAHHGRALAPEPAAGTGGARGSEAAVPDAAVDRGRGRSPGHRAAAAAVSRLRTSTREGAHDRRYLHSFLLRVHPLAPPARPPAAAAAAAAPGARPSASASKSSTLLISRTP